MWSVGSVDDAQLRWAYRNAHAAVVTCAEDFGLVPLEAAAHGLVTIAPDARGLRDHDPATLRLYEFGSVDGLVEAIDQLSEPVRRLDSTSLGRERFTAAMREIVASVAASG